MDNKTVDGKLLNTLGRLREGNNAVYKVFETQLGRINVLDQKQTEQPDC